MRSQWQQFLESGGVRPKAPTIRPVVPPSETAAVVRQGTLRSLTLLGEQHLSREEARRCAEQVAQLRQQLARTESVFRRLAGQPF